MWLFADMHVWALHNRVCISQRACRTQNNTSSVAKINLLQWMRESSQWWGITRGFHSELPVSCLSQTSHFLTLSHNFVCCWRKHTDTHARRYPVIIHATPEGLLRSRENLMRDIFWLWTAEWRLHHIRIYSEVDSVACGVNIKVHNVPLSEHWDAKAAATVHIFQVHIPHQLLIHAETKEQLLTCRCVNLLSCSSCQLYKWIHGGGKHKVVQ